MNCEHVKELLSAYLDNTLTANEREVVTAHVDACSECHSILDDFHRFDTLLSQLPRVSPGPHLRQRIFTSPDYLELTGTSGRSKEQTHLRASAPLRSPDRPKLVALPGGRQTGLPTASEKRMVFPAQRRSRGIQTIHIMQALIAACVLLTLAMGGFIGWNIYRHSQTVTHDPTAITPPAGPMGGPIPAGTRFVFLRDGALWSAPTDGGTEILRLTPSGTTVATNWVVRPALPGRSAGNMLAYIDLQQGRVHIIRSDGQSDTTIQPPLLQTHVQPSTIWDTDIGHTLLNSLAWSPDRSMLAFVADPKGTGQPKLYIYSMMTGTTQDVPLPTNGSISHPIWSPDSIRIAFEFSNNGSTGILDYNTQNHGVLTITPTINTPDDPTDTLQGLGWSPDIDAPAITWSVGGAGHIHSIWIQRVGLAGTPKPHEIITGDYAQASYNRNAHNGTGSWLLVTAHTGDILTVGLTAALNRYTYGKQATAAQWSPDGTHIAYFDGLTGGMGTLHVLNTLIGNDAEITVGVTNEPAPEWSPDSQLLAYSTGTHILVANMQAYKAAQPLKMQGAATALVWSTTAPYQLILATSDGQPGIYLADLQHGTFLRLDQKEMQGPVFWTQIP